MRRTCAIATPRPISRPPMACGSDEAKTACCLEYPGVLTLAMFCPVTLNAWLLAPKALTAVSNTVKLAIPVPPRSPQSVTIIDGGRLFMIDHAVTRVALGIFSPKLSQQR